MNQQIINKSVLCLSLAAILGLSVTGCGTNKPASDASAVTKAGDNATTEQIQDNPDKKIASEHVDDANLPVVDAIITHAPEAPPPIDRDYPAKVVVKMETVEKIGTMADGVEYMYWTFGGQVPGQMIRVREGDTVEVHLSNHPSSKMPHNVDFHAATGPGGGAEASMTAPGHTSTFSFKTLNPGLYIYHCAVAPVGMHVANGMYGLILVEPKEGLPKVDKEYYIVQGDFYTKGKYGERGLQPFDMEKAIKEDADYVVFNGSVGSMVGDKALKANVGDSVRFFVGNGGPNLSSSFHLIGEIFDKVFPEGGTSFRRNIQTTAVPPGAAAITEFKVDVPGNYVIVDHALTRAFNKGALGILTVTGDENHAIYSHKQKDSVYLPEGGASQQMPDSPAAPVQKAPTSDKDQISQGKAVYDANCAACHQPDGKGVPNAFPPLAASDYFNADHKRAASIVANGLSGEITVNGAKYNSVMPAVALSDQQIANVITYVANSFGNKPAIITEADVAQAKKTKPTP